MNLTDKLVADIVTFFRNADYQVWLSYLKSFMAFLTIVFGFLFALIVYKLRSLVKEQVEELVADVSPPAGAVSAYDIRWEEIKKHVNSFNEAEWKMAVIEADKFVDDALKTGGYPGESMGERLMLIEPGQILSLQELWDAHKLRNLLVHDINYQLNHRQAVVAVESFEKTLRELGALT